MERVKHGYHHGIRHRIIVITCVLALLTAGCGKTENNGNPGQGSTGISGSDHPVTSWQASYAPLRNRYQYALSAGTDRIYGCYVKEGQVLLDVMDKRNFSVKETLTVPDVSYVAGMAADSEGNVYLMGEKGEGTGLWRIAPEGEIQDHAELELEDTEKCQDLSLKGIDTDQDGHFFIWCEMLVQDEESGAWHYEDRVYVKDAQLNTLFCEKIADLGGTELMRFQVGTDGQPLFIVKDLDGVYVQEMDVAQKGRKEAVRLEKCEDFSDTAYVNGMETIVPTEEGFLYCHDNALFTFRYDTQKTEKLFSLSTYGIFSSDLLFLKKDGDAIEMIDNHEGVGQSEFISLAVGASEKKIVTLGSTLMLPDLEKVVAEFNRYSGGYRVEITDYNAQEGSHEKALERLKLDIVSGKAPDLITVAGLDYGTLSAKGVFADLYGFMEEDEECTRAMLVQSVARAYEDRGCLYRISPSFQLHSMWGYRDVTGGKSGVTFDELFRTLEDSGKDLNSIGGFSADEPVLSRLCLVSMDEFIDWETGTCSFDGDHFKRALSFAKEYTGNYTGGTYSERIAKREVVMSVGIIASVVDYQIQNELYGGNVAFIGYPVAKGSGTAVTFRSDARHQCRERKSDRCMGIREVLPAARM